MPRPKNTELRKQQIVEALLEVMSERSYERATISAIAKSAGLAPGVVHYHFPSKQAILLELTEQLAQRLEVRFQSLAQEETPLARLDAFIDARLATGEGADSQAVACWVAIGTESLRQPEVAEIYRGLMSRQAEALKTLLQPLMPADRSADEAAPALLAAIEGCFQIAAAVPELAPPGFAARSVKAMARGLVGAF